MMRHLRQLLICVAIILTPELAVAEKLSGATLLREVSGKTVYLSVASGVELPIQYRSGGVMEGRLTGLAAILPTGLPSKDQGKWWISKNRLCQTWKQWLKAKRYCYTLTRVNGKLHWRRNDGRRGTLRVRVD